VALALADGGGLWLAYGTDTADGVRLDGACSTSLTDPGELGQQLTAWVQQYSLANAPVSLVLSASDYQVVMIEAPDVAETELREAARWGARDFLKFEAQNAVVDVFPVPSPSGRAQQSMLNVVAADQSRVDFLTNQLKRASLRPAVVDIPELCLRNLAVAVEASGGRGQGVIYLDRDEGMLNILCGDELYLTRGVSVGAATLESAEIQDRTRMLDEVVLELQRSFDYYERHFSQAPIRRVVVAPSEPNVDFLGEQLKYELNIEIAAMALDGVLGMDSARHHIAGPGTLALGALLRDREDWL